MGEKEKTNHNLDGLNSYPWLLNDIINLYKGMALTNKAKN